MSERIEEIVSPEARLSVFKSKLPFLFFEETGKGGIPIEIVSEDQLRERLGNIFNSGNLNFISDLVNLFNKNGISRDVVVKASGVMLRGYLDEIVAELTAQNNSCDSINHTNTAYGVILEAYGMDEAAMKKSTIGQALHWLIETDPETRRQVAIILEAAQEEDDREAYIKEKSTELNRNRAQGFLNILGDDPILTANKYKLLIDALVDLRKEIDPSFPIKEK